MMAADRRSAWALESSDTIMHLSEVRQKCSALTRSGVNYFTLERHFFQNYQNTPIFGRAIETRSASTLGRQDGWAGRGSTGIVLFELDDERSLRQITSITDPQLGNPAVAPADAPDLLAMTGKAIGESDAAVILAGNRNFARIRQWLRQG